MNLAEGPPVDGVEPKAALASGPNQARLAKGPEVLGRRRLGHPEPAGHFTDGELAFLEEIKHRPPDRLGQRSEGPVRLDLRGHGVA
jgi:hypothetical protein